LRINLFLLLFNNLRLLSDLRSIAQGLRHEADRNRRVARRAKPHRTTLVVCALENKLAAAAENYHVGFRVAVVVGGNGFVARLSQLDGAKKRCRKIAANTPDGKQLALHAALSTAM